MNSAVLLSACVAVLQLGMAALLLSVSRAPGWHRARLFAAISLAAAGYSAGNITSAWFPMADEVRVWGAQFSYCMAALFVCCWLLHAFGDGTFRVRALPRWVQGLFGACLLGGLLALLTRWHVVPGAFTDIDIPWAGVQYRFARPSPLGDVLAYLDLVAVLVVCVRFVWGGRRGRPINLGYVVGFSLFFAATTIEVLVTNGILDFFFMADVGFLAVVIPLGTETVRRFVDEARRLSVTSSRLTEEVEIRTQERDQAQSALLEAERHAALGRLSAGVGHEINNPLAYLRLNVELIGEWGRAHNAPDELMESVESALDGADRIRKVVDALRAYARAGAGPRLVVLPESFVQGALRVAAHQLRTAATVTTRFESTPPILGDEAKLVQAVVSVLLNASQALTEAASDRPGVVEIHVYAAEGSLVHVDVRDNGPGVPADDLRRLTEPYFTTRADCGGMGLGLFLARGVVEQHGGELVIESEVGKGTLVSMRLPVTAQRSSVAASSEERRDGVVDGRLAVPRPVEEEPRPGIRGR